MTGENSRGMTLVEVMIVVAILAVLSMIAYPSFSRSIQKYKVRTCASEIAMNLKLTRSQAISEPDRNYIFVLNPGSLSYSFGYDSDGDLIPDGFGSKGAVTVSIDSYGPGIVFGSDASQGPSDSFACSGSVPVSGISGFGGNSFVFFNSDGTLSGTGCIFIKDGSGNNFLVSVESISGKVTLWNWGGGNDWKKVY